MILDDNQEIRDYIKDVLGDESYALDEAENGKIALEKIEKGFYDLIISDLMMPWIDGFELMKTLPQQMLRAMTRWYKYGHMRFGAHGQLS